MQTLAVVKVPLKPILTFILITGITGLLCSAYVHRHHEMAHQDEEVCAP